ncbi:hypothetical protein GJ496_008112 [Pomphorhynchus laevis]|nr:hypothetical protein GJ496_008112 [Pomphorhynchus laevis]
MIVVLHCSLLLVNNLSLRYLSSTKLKYLINCVSPKVYSYFKQCETYTEAIDLLTQCYTKLFNAVAARYRHITRTQQVNETVSDYLRGLRRLAEQCKYKSVRDVQAKEEAIPDTLIAGMSSRGICQKLLEYTDMTIDKAIETAIIFEQVRIDNYMYTGYVQCSAVLGDEVNVLLTKTGHIYPESNVHMSHNENTYQNIPQPTLIFLTSNKRKCFFCGGASHSREKCPARDAICTKCGKIGHYARAYMSQQSNSVIAYVASTIANCPVLTTTRITKIQSQKSDITYSDCIRLLRAKFGFAMARAVSLGIQANRIPGRQMARSQLNNMDDEQKQGVCQLELT